MVPVSGAHDKLSSLRPVTPPRNLTRAIAERIAGDIIDGRLPPGTRLPTEQSMGAAMGVSRTTIREAVAALRADGLVVTRQGAGAFVAPGGPRRPFRLAVEGLPSVEEVLDVMELRASVEVEAAGLAAERATVAARRRIGRALAAIDAVMRRGDNAIDQDFLFHLSIARATANPQFVNFLEYLGGFIIPRQTIRVAAHGKDGQRAYLELFQGEHRAIHAAIEAGDTAGAREAMRVHLVNSQARYRQLVADSQQVKQARRGAAPNPARGQAPGP
jgi:GntR family transcriptional repressor for pyruvate dehydrogenase complex